MYPSTISSFTDPQPTDRLNSPAHSAIHSSVNAAVEQIERFVGTTSSAIGTLMYDIRAAASNGGGHVQTAAKGGTGQTTFTKGDLLVATGPSVLTKLAVGTDGQILSASSVAAAGVAWVNSQSSKVFASVVSSMIGSNTVAEASIFSATIPGSTLGIDNAIRATVNIRDFAFAGATSSVLLQGVYGGARVASVLLSAQDLTPGTGLKGTVQFDLFANGNAAAQSGDLKVSLAKNLANLSSVIGNFNMETGIASVNSSASKTLGVTMRYSTADGNNQLRVGGVVVERII